MVFRPCENQNSKRKSLTLMLVVLNPTNFVVSQVLKLQTCLELGRIAGDTGQRDRDRYRDRDRERERGLQEITVYAQPELGRIAGDTGQRDRDSDKDRDRERERGGI